MRVAALVFAVALTGAAASAQQQPAARQPAAPAQPDRSAAAPRSDRQEPSGEHPTYVYQPDGRRDPFLSLIGTGAEPRTGNARRGEGPAAMTVDEISVRGVVQSRGELVAMIHGPDNKTYIVHPGDKLADGAIKSITPQGLVIIQEVNDPLSLVKQREVRKLLRSLEDGKE